jgi:hypothetical protein
MCESLLLPVGSGPRRDRSSKTMLGMRASRLARSAMLLRHSLCVLEGGWRVEGGGGVGGGGQC